MVKTRVTKTCEICHEPFEVIKSRENVARFCSRECYDIHQTQKIPWNKSKSYEELFSLERVSEIKAKQSESSSGEKNPMFGKHHSEVSKAIMSEKKQGYVPWNTGKKYPGMFNHVDRIGPKNAYIKYILKKEGITYEEYLQCMDDKRKYYRAVRNITNLQPIHLLENFEKRARFPDEQDAYHLDHIYSISEGFCNKIPPPLIGDISNLRFIPWRENVKKADRILYENSICN
jgi:hypothetical protein